MVKPLLKNANLPLIRSNYRPVSNIPFLSKITEKAALSQFGPYMEENQLIPSYQSAYRANHSTETATVKLVNDLLWGMERSHVTSLVAMDLSAAFDTVDHAILLDILQRSYGVEGTALRWFDDYLRGRTMQVQIKDALSSPRAMNFSVPQGSVAGPVLFTAYISSLPNILQEDAGSITGYADDHHLYKLFDPNVENSELDTTASLQQSLMDIKTWMDSLYLKMNETKTEYIQFGSYQQLSKCKCDKIDVNGSEIRKSCNIKILGAYLDENLSFKKHVQVKCSVASRNIQYVTSIRKHITTSVATQLMSSLVLSHLDFGNAILAGLPCVTIRKMQKVQNWAAKIVLCRKLRDSSRRALFDLHWLPIAERINFKLASLTFRAVHGQAPVYLCNLISLKQYGRNTRAANSGTVLNVPTTKRMTFAERSFSVYGPKLWNSLPHDLKVITDYMLFRSQLKTYLFRNTFLDFLSF
jgi:hypothetical protein